MNKKISDIVDKTNAKHLPPLFDRVFGEGEVEPKNGESAVSVTDRKIISGVECFYGETTGGLGEISSAIKLGRSHGYCAVGTVIDSQSRDPSTKGYAEPNTSDEVVILVGINYGQGSGYLKPITTTQGSCPVGRFDNTGMRSRTASVINKLRGQGCSTHLPNPANVTLIATNYFPWITSSPWSKATKNCIEEALLMKCFGYSDPHDHVVGLVQDLYKAFSLTVVFHGANNGVPHMAMETCRRLEKLKAVPRNLILVDNLTGGNLNNYVRLSCCKYSGNPTARRNVRRTADH